MPEIARLDTAYGQLQLWTGGHIGFLELRSMRPGLLGSTIVSSIFLDREQAAVMGRLISAVAAGPRPIGDVLAPVLQRAGVTRDMLVEDAEIVPGATR